MTRPPGPVPLTRSTLMLCSATRRRTTGDSSRLSDGASSAGAAGVSATGAGAAATGAAGAGAGGAGASAAAGAGASASAGAGASATGALGGSAGGSSAALGSGSGAGAGAAAPSASPTTAITAPTGTVSPSCTRISVTVPVIGEGTSVSTLSVLTSNNGSSADTESPTFLNQRVMVPSVTVSPSCGNVTSAIVWSSLFDRFRRSGCGP